MHNHFRPQHQTQMRWLAVLLTLLVVQVPPARAQVSRGAGFVYEDGFAKPPGVGAAVHTYTPAAREGDVVSSSGRTLASASGASRPPYRYLPLTCVALPQGSGDVVVSLDQSACRTPTKAPTPVAPQDLPSPWELAWIAADRAMSIAEWPQLRIAPGRTGLTGLRSFFWLDHEPRPVSASASVPRLVVTAQAEPVTYTWSFGDGASRPTHHVGRAWSRRRDGNIGHMYQRRGVYPVSVRVLWRASWRMGSGAWQHLGYFSNDDSVSYHVRQMVAMLRRRR